MPSLLPWLDQVPLLGSHNTQDSSTPVLHTLDCLCLGTGLSSAPDCESEGKAQAVSGTVVSVAPGQKQQALRKILHGSNSGAYRLTCRPHPEWITGHQIQTRCRTNAVALTDKLTYCDSRRPTPQLYHSSLGTYGLCWTLIGTLSSATPLPLSSGT